jgi:hypothetical protein
MGPESWAFNPAMLPRLNLSGAILYSTGAFNSLSRVNAALLRAILNKLPRISAPDRSALLINRKA